MSPRLALLCPLLLVLAACSGSSGDEDAGIEQPELDAGATGGGDADAGVDDAGVQDAGPSQLALGAPCAYGSEECGEGQLCSSLYGDSTGNIDQTIATCFARCAAQGNACTAAHGVMGTCQGVSQPGGGQLACVVMAENFGLCANSRNAVCTQGASCLSLAAGADGVCGIVCNPNDDQCAGTMSCSTSPIQVTLQGGGQGGVCSEPSMVGDPCNPDPAEGPVSVCTDGQQCGGVGGNPPFTCNAP